MLQLPGQLIAHYMAHINERGIPAASHAEYRQWLRYYLDFCEKYQVTAGNSERVRLFMAKLRDKNQTEEQQRRAAHAVSLYLEMQLRAGRGDDLDGPSFARGAHPIALESVGQNVPSEKESPLAEGFQRPARGKRPSQYNEAGYQEKSDSPEWDEVLTRLAAEIKVRHYSRKTLKTYANWSRQFQRFLKNKLPQELSTVDVKEYLTYLAVKCNVAASTQNQAFNSLLFLFRHALKADFGDLRDVPRAKKSLYVPMVLSRPEIDAILHQLSHPYNLVVKMLFGCGLRLFEGLQLRVRDFNFDAGILTVHGKGKKDRTVPLPQSIMPELKAQIEAVARLHEQDLAPTTLLSCSSPSIRSGRRWRPQKAGAGRGISPPLSAETGKIHVYVRPLPYSR